jgi:CRP/FNR family transcriptional regulator, cyclic AMP receptor protein
MRAQLQPPSGRERQARALANNKRATRLEPSSICSIFKKFADEKLPIRFSDGQVIYSQDGVADSVFYILKGRVKLAVVSAAGKEAVVSILEDGHFFGQGSLLPGSPLRLTTASSIGKTILASFDRQGMTRRMHGDSKFADAFVSYLVAHCGRMESNLVDQLLNSSEKRLARILLLLANFGKDYGPESVVIPKLSQETLAQMVGASRARVSSFLNKFRKLGFIEYNGTLRVHNSLLQVILSE